MRCDGRVLAWYIQWYWRWQLLGLLLDNEVRDERWIMPRTTSRASFFLREEGKRRMACDEVDARTYWSVSITWSGKEVRFSGERVGINTLHCIVLVVASGQPRVDVHHWPVPTFVHRPFIFISPTINAPAISVYWGEKKMHWPFAGYKTTSILRDTDHLSRLQFTSWDCCHVHYSYMRINLRTTLQEKKLHINKRLFLKI